ncbi:MAG TPA: adenylate/guanylate cyclase domain-containing protein [Actinomycetota bacterium]
MGVLPTDDEDERIRKATLTLSTVLVLVLASGWVITYLLLGLPLSASIPFAYQVVSGASLALFVRTKRYRAFRSAQLGLMLGLPFLLQWSLGGFEASSGVSLWALTSPLGALMFSGTRQAWPWFGGYLALLGISGLVDPGLTPADIPTAVRVAFFVGNVAGVSLTAYLLLQYFVRQREREHRRSERLLLNVLPGPIAARLKEREEVIADRFPEASVLFADIVDFTPRSATLPPERVVELLDEVFTVFDRLADERGLEKIKTIGDAYMLAGGIPEPRADHLEAVADMALAMLASATDRLPLRVGIDTGPVVAGVIGTRKFIYDLWGDTVNTASRMESHGLPGRIQVTERVVRRLDGRFVFEPRGAIEVKGKGTMPTWFLLGPSPPGAPTP